MADRAQIETRWGAKGETLEAHGLTWTCSGFGRWHAQVDLAVAHVSPVHVGRPRSGWNYGATIADPVEDLRVGTRCGMATANFVDPRVALPNAMRLAAEEARRLVAWVRLVAGREREANDRLGAENLRLAGKTDAAQKRADVLATLLREALPYVATDALADQIDAALRLEEILRG